MTHRELAQIQLAVYQGSHALTYFESGSGDDGVTWGAAHAPDGTIIAMEGSHNKRDWLRDFAAFAVPTPGRGLGFVHPGFLDGMGECANDVLRHTRPPYYIIGHSLGAAHAAILTALFVLGKTPVIERVVWGEPLSGFARLAEILSAVPATSYRNKGPNGHDLVTDVPIDIGTEHYVRSTPLTDVCSPPEDKDDWGPLAWHHMELYAKVMS